MRAYSMTMMATTTIKMTSTMMNMTYTLIISITSALVNGHDF